MSKICYQCFRTIQEEDAVCPYCGFRNSDCVVNERILSPGTVLNNKYILGKSLGEGGFGITYLAWDRNMEVRIAIKEYYPSNLVIRDPNVYGGNTLHTVTSTGTEDFKIGLQRYAKEAAILSKFFNLPGIVSVKDFFYENGTAYMAMEYIDGISLKEFLKQKGNTLSVAETLDIVKPIIVSLAIVHNNKLLHRDISPDNIMISKDGQVKLIDFGAARYFESDSDKSMTVVLKHGYAPIEQYSRKSVQGEATDIYSLCAVMYRMITGEVPEEALERVHQDHLLPMKHYKKKIPSHVAMAIEKGLSVDYKDRQQNMQELYNDLYATKKQLWEKRGDKVYSVIRKGLLILIMILLLIILGSVLFITNRDRIDKFENKVKAVFAEDTESSAEPQEQNDDAKEKQNRDVKKEQDDNAEEGQDQDVAEEQNQNVVEEQKQSIEAERNEKDTQEMEHAVVVVSKGVLNGRSDAYTVEEILNQYCDRPGTWTADRDESGNVYVLFSGSRLGETFTLEFQVFSGDTFKLTGATRNGEEYEQYSTFFQEILNEVGA